MKERFRRFMTGRYGVDGLSKFMMGAVFTGLIISLFWNNWVLNLIVWVLLIWTYFRMFSRNIQKRYQENVKFYNLKNKILGKTGRASSTDKAHKVFLCPDCKQKIRVPKGKGKIAITCPKCRKEFIKRT